MFFEILKNNYGLFLSILFPSNVTGSNILLARMATKKAKPDGQYHLQPDEVDDFIRGQLVTSLPGKCKASEAFPGVDDPCSPHLCFCSWEGGCLSSRVLPRALGRLTLSDLLASAAKCGKTCRAAMINFLLFSNTVSTVTETRTAC